MPVGIGDINLLQPGRLRRRRRRLGILHQAAMAVATGSANYVVCYRDLNGRSGQRYSEGVSGDIVTSDLIHWSWYMPCGPADARELGGDVHPALHARDGHQGAPTSPRSPVQHAQPRDVNNPNAFFYQRPLTVEEHQGAKWIVEPLRLYDCCHGDRRRTAPWS